MKKQNMVAVSEDSKGFIVALCERFPDQPGKGDKPYDLTQREAVDAIVAFAETHGVVEVEETNDQGETILVKVDHLAKEVQRTLALRGATVRANSATAALSEAQKELAEAERKMAELEAKLAALGVTVWSVSGAGGNGATRPRGSQLKSKYDQSYPPPC